MTRLALPLPPLDNIKDPDVRAAFRSLVDYFAGTELLTAQDFANAGKSGGGNVPTGVPVPGGSNLPSVWNRPPKPGEVGAILSYLENSIRESALFRILGTRLDLIDRPGDGLVYRIGNAEGSLAAHGATLQGIGSEIYDQIIPRLSDVGTSIEHLKTQISQYGDVVALVQERIYTGANQFTSLAEWSITTQATIHQIGSDVDGLFASVQTYQGAQASLNGQLSGLWTVRMDLNGHVGGFGYQAWGNRAKVETMFLVRADTMAIAGTDSSTFIAGPPERLPGETEDAWVARVNAWGTAITQQNADLLYWAQREPHQDPGESDADYANRLNTYRAVHGIGQVAVPFIVKTIWWQDDGGNWQPPGVYMRRAMVERLVVDTAYIREASVTTLKIRDEAVTVPRSYQVGSIRGDGTGQIVVDYLFSVFEPVSMMMIMSARQGYLANGAHLFQFWMDGYVFKEWGGAATSDYVCIAHTWDGITAAKLQPGQHRLQIVWNAPSDIYLMQTNVVLLGTYR